MMQYKVFPTFDLWSFKDGPTIWLWKKDCTWWAKLLMSVLNLVPSHPIWGNDELRVGEKERFISSRILKYIEFGSLGCWRTIRILELWVLMWNTKRTFWSYYQDLSHDNVLFCWKAFGLLVIGKLIMNAHPFVLLLMLTLKIMSSLDTVGLERYALLWTLLHTHLFMICLLVILFLCSN